MQWCACGNLASGRECLWRSSSRPCSASNILEMSKISSSIPIAAAAALFVVSMSPNSRSPKASLYLFGSSLTQLNSSCRNESLPERRSGKEGGKEGDHPKSPEKTIKERGKDNSFSPSPSSTSSSSSSPSERLLEDLSSGLRESPICIRDCLLTLACVCPSAVLLLPSPSFLPSPRHSMRIIVNEPKKAVFGKISFSSLRILLLARCSSWFL